MSITNSNGTDQARRSAAESDLYELALEALAAQEESSEHVIAEGDAQARAAYARADLTTRSALQDLSAVATDGYGTDEVAKMLDLHTKYGVATEAMFALATGDPDLAEVYKETYVDVYFDPLSGTLVEHAKDGYGKARAALASIARTQHLLKFATPAIFGLALVLLASFVVTLTRSRRVVLSQARENRHQSLHDALTDLPNRVFLHRRGTTCMEQSLRTGLPVALMLLDIDRFKEINDTLGHHHGDVVLQAVADRLRKAVRATDIVTRLGGDEFAILLPQVQDVACALEVATKVQDALRTSVNADGVLLDIDISMGLALSGLHGEDISTLLKHADIAMYHAKERDLGVCVYDQQLNEHSADQLGLLGELRRAIDNDELVLHFQPKVSLPGVAFFGAEALLRWEHPTRGLIPPGLFIPAAERTALIRPLTAWVLNAALAECKSWHDKGQPLTIAVNVSARNLLDASFADDVLELLARWDLPTKCLLLEVTESAIMVDPARAESILRRFASMGIELAIDDFGAGYTSLAHLRTLPVQELKIDQSLVRQMSISAADTLIIGAIIDLAHSLGLRTVAEGVEDADTLGRLSVLGCDIAQGFHLARPMTAANLHLWSQRTPDGRIVPLP